MKRFFFLMFACTALMFACTKPDEPTPGPGPDDPTPGPGPEPTVEYYSSISATLNGSNMKSKWAEGDEIQIYNVTQDGNDVEAKYVLSSGAGSATGTFVPADGKGLEKGGKGYFAAYPYNEDVTFAQHNTFSISVPAEQTAAAPMFAYADDAASLNFASFMGAVKFTLSGKGNIGSLSLDDANTNNILSGNVTINPKTNKVTFKNGSSSKNSISYKFPAKLELDNSTSPEIVLEIPAGCLADGASMTLIDMNNAPLAVIEVPGKTVEAGKIADLGKLEFKGQSQTIDLSAVATANSYIIPDIGTYKFALVRGNDKSQVLEPAYLEVLWETYNQPEVEVVAGSLIKEVNIEDGYAVVTVAEPFHAGNALIAARDARGNIFWTWHLWIPETPVATVPDPDKAFWATEILDRNLGALIVTPDVASGEVPSESYGLFFQWGRKDPMTGPFAVAGMEMAAVTKDVMTREETIANPTEITTGQAQNCWAEALDVQATFWDNNGEKTIYDPCPPGYKIPVYDAEFPMWQTTSSGTYDENWTFDMEHMWFKFNATGATFPLCGYLSGGASLTKFGIRTLLWSATMGLGSEEDPRGSASFFDLSRDNGKAYYKSYFKYAAGIIRCALEH